ncbi:MAG TPA: flagellar biosynthesis protein FlhB [Tepidisphaeraceae bacterium]|jgi:flagellar biosynthetic protein FlhB|nr:flagellar biosynthesis protein FlhB [Tepidisphaeraceae bacterium]
MAESEGEKTEAPTPRRRQEAREQGQVARSQDLSAALLLLATLLLLNATGTGIIKVLKDLTAKMLGEASMANFDIYSGLLSLGQAIREVGIAMAPLLGGIIVVAILANVLQIGLVFNPARLALNFNALNPVGGFSKIFSSGMKPIPMLINIVKLVALSAVAYSALHGRIGLVVGAQQFDHMAIFDLAADAIYSIALRLAIALLIIAIIEYVYRRWRLEQDLKMSKQDVKEEMRRMDGDPKVKQRRRQIAIQRARQKLKKDVPTADVVVTNPTHYAVAIQYDSATMRAPKVVAKGQDFMALRIREIAIEHGVPILERKPLARALYQTVDVGQEVPEEFYSAIAEILAYVYELNGKMKRRAS